MINIVEVFIMIIQYLKAYQILTRRPLKYFNFSFIYLPNSSSFKCGLLNNLFKKWTNFMNIIDNLSIFQELVIWMSENNFKSHHRNLFSKTEDEKLKRLVVQYGDKWNKVAEEMEGRNARQCRDRFNTYLSPNSKIGNWSKEEDQLLLKLYNEFGNQWVKISKHFNNRTDTAIKNRFNNLKSERKKPDHEHLTKFPSGKTLVDIMDSKSKEPFNIFPSVIPDEFEILASNLPFDW